CTATARTAAPRPRPPLASSSAWGRRWRPTSTGAPPRAPTPAIPTPSLPDRPSGWRSRRPWPARDQRLLPVPAPPLAGAPRHPAPGAGAGGDAVLQALRVDGGRHDDLRPPARAPAVWPRGGLGSGGRLPRPDRPLQPRV